MVWTPQPPCLDLSGEPWPCANMLAYLRLPRDNDLLVRNYSPVKAGPE